MAIHDQSRSTSLPGEALPGVPAAHGVVRSLGAACVVGGALGLLITTAQVVYSSSSTEPDHLWRFPWSSDVYIVVGLLWCLSHVLCLAGLVGMRRSGHGGPSRAAAAGAVLAITGTLLILVGELAGLRIGDRAEDSNSAVIVVSIYGVATLVAVVGLGVIGRQALRTRSWEGWRRKVPLAMAGWGLMLLWLPATPLAPVGSFGIDALFVALGCALLTHPVARTR